MGLRIEEGRIDIHPDGGRVVARGEVGAELINQLDGEGGEASIICGDATLHPRSVGEGPVRADGHHTPCETFGVSQEHRGPRRRKCLAERRGIREMVDHGAVLIVCSKLTRRIEFRAEGRAEVEIDVDPRRQRCVGGYDVHELFAPGGTLISAFEGVEEARAIFILQGLKPQARFVGDG